VDFSFTKICHMQQSFAIRRGHSQRSQHHQHWITVLVVYVLILRSQPQSVLQWKTLITVEPGTILIRKPGPPEGVTNDLEKVKFTSFALFTSTYQYGHIFDFRRDKSDTQFVINSFARKTWPIIHTSLTRQHITKTSKMHPNTRKHINNCMNVRMASMLCVH